MPEQSSSRGRKSRAASSPAAAHGRAHKLPVLEVVQQWLGLHAWRLLRRSRLPSALEKGRAWGAGLVKRSTGDAESHDARRSQL